MNYAFIEQHRAEFSIKVMLRVLRVARSGWYAWRHRRNVISARQRCDSAVCIHTDFIRPLLAHSGQMLGDYGLL